MAQQIQLRRDTAANWTSINPVLASGEIGVETDTGKLKIGNGASAWSALAYFSGGSGAVASVFGRTGTVTASSGDYNAGQVTNTPAGGIAATTVQAALNELDGEKAPLDSPAFTTRATTPQIGVNATPDATNRVSVSATATLLNHEGAGHQVKVNKNAAANTASFLFQTGFSGRAEIGTTGDDDFHFKVSPDGAAWVEAMKIDKATGKVTFPVGSGQTQVDVYTASTTWTRPAWARTVTVTAIAAGGGGGSGRRGAAGTARIGGLGGAGGMFATHEFRASDLGATESVTVGAGGPGGAGQTTDDTNGNDGGAGGNSSFGSWLLSRGGPGGIGGGTSNSANYAKGFGAPAFSGNGCANTVTADQPARGGGGGGNAGGVTSGNVAGNGAAGISGSAAYAPGTTGGSGGTPGSPAAGAGSAVTAGQPFGGAGGGGGAGQSSAAGGAGGAGGKYGGGGGAGGGSVNGFASGVGGAGADGIVVVVSKS